MHQDGAKQERRSIPGSLIVRLVSLAYRFPRATLLAAVLLAGISAYLFITRLQYHTQRSDLMGEHSESLVRWKKFVAEFGDDDDMVVVVRGNDPEQMKLVLEGAAEKIAAEPEMFDRLFYKVDLRTLQNRALLYLSSEQISRIQNDLQSMQRLLGPGQYGWQLCTLGSMANEARLRLAKLPKAECHLSAEDSEFFRQFVEICAAAQAKLDDPKCERSPWLSMTGGQSDQQNQLAEPQYFFNGDQSLAFLLVRPVKAAESFTPAEASVSRLREIVGEIAQEHSGVEAGVTGLPVLETDEMMASQNDTKTAGWLALAGVLVLGFVFFRGIRYPLLAMITLVIGTVWAAGWLTVTVGHVNILSATFAMMLIGLGDYGAVWIANYEQARRGGADVPVALRFTARTIGPSIFMAGLTSSLAFFAAMLADFHAVTELGWIAGCGVQLCVLSTYTTLPAMLALCDRRGVLLAPAIAPLRVFDPSTVRGGNADAPGVPPLWLPGLARRPGLVAGVCVALTVVLGVFALGIRYDHNLLHLQARNLDSVQWETALIDGTAGASWHAVSYTDTPEEALARKAEFEKLDSVSRVVELASLVPSDQEPKFAQLRDIQQRLKDLPPRGAEFSHLFPTAPQPLEAEIDRVLSTLADHPNLRLVEVRASLTSLRDAVGALPRTVAARHLREFDRHLVMSLIENLYRLRDVATPAPIVLSDIPPAFRERYLGTNGKWLLRVFAKESLWDYEPLERFVGDVRTVDADASGKPFGTLEGLRGMKDSFLWAAVYAVGVIVMVLILGFRSWRTLVLLLVPLVMGALITLGTMRLLGLALNPANVIALPIIVGVGVVNAVHVMHDYLLRRARAGYSLNRAIGKGLLVSALNTVLGFGTLMISSHRGLVSLGFMLALGVFCCMAMGQVFLPALLNLVSRKRGTVDTDAAVTLPLRRAA